MTLVGFFAFRFFSLFQMYGTFENSNRSSLFMNNVLRDKKIKLHLSQQTNTKH